MSSSNSPCAACKLQRRKCTQECIFAPYFPADKPQKFAYIHKVFGASNIAKLLAELSVHQREDAVESLAYEAETRLRDPVYGCVGLISLLQQKLKLLQNELSSAKKELATYIGPQALLPMVPTAHQPGPSGAFVPQPHLGSAGPSSSSLGVSLYAGAMPLPTHHQAAGPLVIRQLRPQAQHQQQQQVGFDLQAQAQHQHQQVGFDLQAQAQHEQQQQVGFDLQAHAQHQQQQQVGFDLQAAQREMYRGLYERQRQQQEIKFNGAAGFDGAMLSGGYNYNHPYAGGVAAQTAVSPSLALGGTFEGAAPYQIQRLGDQQGGHHAGSSSGSGFPNQPNQQHDFQPHLPLQPQNEQATVPQEQQQEQQGSGREQHSCAEGPSC